MIAGELHVKVCKQLLSFWLRFQRPWLLVDRQRVCSLAKSGEICCCRQCSEELNTLRLFINLLKFYISIDSFLQCHWLLIYFSAIFSLYILINEIWKKDGRFICILSNISGAKKSKIKLFWNIPKLFRYSNIAPPRPEFFFLDNYA